MLCVTTNAVTLTGMLIQILTNIQGTESSLRVLLCAAQYSYVSPHPYTLTYSVVTLRA
jgi:hypothetical protein